MVRRFDVTFGVLVGVENSGVGGEGRREADVGRGFNSLRVGETASGSVELRGLVVTTTKHMVIIVVTIMRNCVHLLALFH